MRHNEQAKTELTKNLSPLGAWAFAIGTSIGWGSLVVTNNAYLAQAGPLGSVIGMVIGAIVMLLISRNYSYLMNAYPDSGGAYTYSKEVFGRMVSCADLSCHTLGECHLASAVCKIFLRGLFPFSKALHYFRVRGLSRRSTVNSCRNYRFFTFYVPFQKRCFQIDDHNGAYIYGRDIDLFFLPQ